MTTNKQLIEDLIFQLSGERGAQVGTGLRNDAEMARDADVALFEESRRRHAQELAAIAEAAFVKRFGYAPETTIPEHAALTCDDLTFHYRKDGHYVLFSLRLDCPLCGDYYLTPANQLGQLGEVLKNPPLHRYCPSQPDPAESKRDGVEFQLIAALAEFVAEYAPQ